MSETPTAILSDDRTMTEPDGSTVTIARFHARKVQFALHDGSQDPPSGGVTIPTDAGEAVSSTERPSLLAAFNGGFKASAGVGGFEVDGHVLSPLVTGEASAVVDADGAATVGVWGRTVPRPGEQVVSVRQNLPPLVESGQASPNISDVSKWGDTIGNQSSVARSGLGEDGAGDLLYAGSSSALPADIADALIAAGAQTAMELDINPEWVQLDLASAPGAALQAAIPSQRRPVDQYLSGWTRDFFVVLASP